MPIYFSDSFRDASLLASRSMGEAAAATSEFEDPASSYDTSSAEFIAHAATRARRESTCSTTVDSDLVHYIDAGVWGLGHDGNTSTTFALIAGRDVLVCDWLNMRRDGAAYGGRTNAAGQQPTIECGWPSSAQEWWGSLAPGADRFLRVAHGQQRGFVLGAARALTELTGPDQPILILPDLHIRLRTGLPLDLFRWGDPLVQLDSELQMLLDMTRDEDVETAQAGDLYETWETEALLRLKLLELVTLVDETFSSPTQARYDFQFMINDRRMLHDRLFESSSWHQWSQRHPTALSADEVRANSIQVTSTESLEAAIRAQHSSLFSGGQLTDNDVYGNHDNNRRNQFWESVAPARYRDYVELRDATQSSSSDRRPDHVRLGNGNCIWIEHGHKYDWHNNDANWWQSGRGFGAVEMMVHGSVWIEGSVGTDVAQWSVGQARSGADMWTDLSDYEMQHFTLLRVDELFNGTSGLSLVTLGHTHTACLIEGRRGSSFFWMHPHARRYLASGYCLPAAATLARGLSGAPPT